MEKVKPGLYWYNGDGHWKKPRTLQIEVNDKNQWRHTVMDHPAYSHVLLPTRWYPHASSAFNLGEGQRCWTRHEIEDPYVETDF